MKKKVALTAAAVALVGTLAVGGTLAWFTDTETATNVVTTGNVDIAWFEGNGTEGSEKKITTGNPGMQFGNGTPVTPGQNLDKEARIKNEGKNAAYIRAKIVFLDKDQEVIEKPEYMHIAGTDIKWMPNASDGYYYYNEIVEPGEFTDKIMTDILIATTANNQNFADKEITVRLDAEAIQSDNLGVTSCKDAFLDKFGKIEDKNTLSYDTETEAETTAEGTTGE